MEIPSCEVVTLKFVFSIPRQWKKCNHGLKKAKCRVGSLQHPSHPLCVGKVGSLCLFLRQRVCSRIEHCGSPMWAGISSVPLASCNWARFRVYAVIMRLGLITSAFQWYIGAQFTRADMKISWSLSLGLPRLGLHTSSFPTLRFGLNFQRVYLVIVQTFFIICFVIDTRLSPIDGNRLDSLGRRQYI